MNVPLELEAPQPSRTLDEKERRKKIEERLELMITREILQSNSLTFSRHSYGVIEQRIFLFIRNALVHLFEKYLEKYLQSPEPTLHHSSPFRNGEHITIRIDLNTILTSEHDKNYLKVKQALQRLQDMKIIVRVARKWQSTVLVRSVSMEHNDGFALALLDPIMLQAMFDWELGYTKFNAYASFHLTSRFSPRLLEIISGNTKSITFTISNLKTTLGVEKAYGNNHNFQRKVIDVAKRELDSIGDWSFDYTLMKTGRRFTHITLTPIPPRTAATGLLDKLEINLPDTTLIKFLNGRKFSPRELKSNDQLLSGILNTNLSERIVSHLESKKVRAAIETAQNPKGYIIEIMRNRFQKLTRTGKFTSKSQPPTLIPE